MLTELGILALLLLLNGFFAMAELAVVSARRTRLKQMAEEGNEGARWMLAVAEEPTTFLSVVQVGVTLNSILAGAFSGATLAGRFEQWLEQFPLLAPSAPMIAMAAVVSAVTYLSLVFGELVPKRIGLVYAESIAARIAPFVRFLIKLLSPVVWLLKISTDISMKLLRLEERKVASVTEDEVKDMISEGAETGVFKQVERTMLEGVLRLEDRTVRSIMTPRIDMAWLCIEDDQKECQEIICSTGYSRFPVATSDLSEVLGVLHVKDVLNDGFEGRTFDFKSVVRPALKIPDTTPVLRLLERFKQSGQHFAIVIDEYGSIEGLVTLTDILEAITGEVPEIGQDAMDKPIQRKDGSWLIDGMASIDEVEILVGLRNMRDEGGDFHTLAGFVIDHLGRLPSAGDRFDWKGARFEVVDMDGRRVDKVLIIPLPEENNL